MKTLKSALLVAALLTSGSAFAATNLIQNGDFESSDLNGLIQHGSEPNEIYWIVPNGNSSLTDWTVGEISIDLIKNGYGAIDDLSVDLAGTSGPGSISQSFNIMAGWTYILDFDMGTNGYRKANVTFGGTTHTATLPDGLIEEHFQYQFVATSTGPSILTFHSIVGGNSGAVIDNVTVIAVPEPETYALMLAGLGLVGFMARRRKAIAD
jgi:hypothetical protein